ncbi:MAG: tetratricopeptide repeat protein [Spirochaetaceae bacterium]|nr:tetratricopeptide repeat protein [Spirochaetaceae bacterium]
MYIVIISIVGIAAILFIILLLKSFLFPRKILTLNNLIKNGKYQSAIKIGKQLISKDQTNPELHYLLAQAYNLSGKPEIALMEYNKVNQIGNFTGIINEQVFRKTIAGLFMQFNQDEEALKEYLLLTKKDPYNSDYQYLVGTLLEKRGKPESAIGHYQKAIELDKRNDKAHFFLGKLYYNTQKLPQAKAEMEEAVKYNPDNSQAHFFIGKINKDSHNFTAAITAFEKAQKDPEQKIKSIIEKGVCSMMSGKNDMAIAEFERIIRLSKEATDNEVIHARYFLATCFEKERKIINAIEQWEAINAKKPNFKDVQQKLVQYQDIRTEDVMKDFLIEGNEKFLEMCIKIIDAKGFTQQESRLIKNGCQIVAVDKGSGKWRNIKVQSVLINFFRIPEPVDEPFMRTFIEEMKKLNIIKGIVYSTSDFTRKALTFIENRPVDIVKKEQIIEELKKISH